jgi:hypothetical protein
MTPLETLNMVMRIIVIILIVIQALTGKDQVSIYKQLFYSLIPQFYIPTYSYFIRLLFLLLSGFKS